MQTMPGGGTEMKTPEEIAGEVLRGVNVTPYHFVRAGMAEAYGNTLKRINDNGTFHITDWLMRKAEECGG